MLLRAVEDKDLTTGLSDDPNSALHKQETVRKFSQPNEKEEQEFRVLQGLSVVLGEEEVPEFAAFAYADEKESTVNSVNVMLKSLLEMLQVQFHSVQLGLHRREIKCLAEMLLFDCVLDQGKQQVES